MTAQEMRSTFIRFFTQRGHREISSASLVPDNDPSVLFTTAGMHPLVPYLLGERHPQGPRLVNVQKCLRTDDIDEVGDAFHHTFFEMLGNWSLGEYFKDEAIRLSHEFLTSELGIPQNRLAVTVFGGHQAIPRDAEAYACWKKAGLDDNQIFYGGMKENWWGPVGPTGPCGPDTEIFYDTGGEPCGPGCGPLCGCGRFVEIWNNVFMEYGRDAGGNFHALRQKNVDTGMSLERVLAVCNGVSSNYETELFLPITRTVEALTGVACTAENAREFRIIADHLRAAVFVMGDPKKVAPSNTEQGYVVRRLIRRSIRYLRKLGVTGNILPGIAETVIAINAPVYPELEINREFILTQMDREYAAFAATLDRGMKKAEQFFRDSEPGGALPGELAFRLYDTYGFPVELTAELAREKGVAVDMDGFRRRYLAHQEQSRSGAEIKFKGGLADHDDQTVKLHTATHLLNAALLRVLGDAVSQKGSNITPERLRFDFSFGRKLSGEELLAVSRIVNEAIAADIPVECREMAAEAAKAAGAVGVFGQKYGETVKVYSIAGYSMEICAGPHAAGTGELGVFTILKEESSSAGVRRIKAALR